MKYWLVVVNVEGVQAKFLWGNKEKMNMKQIKSFKKSLKNRLKIKIVFDESLKTIIRNRYLSEDSFINQLVGEQIDRYIQKKYGSWSSHELTGYDIRKRYISGPYIEVLAKLDADNEKEFSKKYESSLKGAIKVLENTVQIKNGGKLKDLEKMIQMLEVNAQ